jgi:hypothetical protein
MNRRIEGFHAEIHCIYASHASLQNLAGHLQVNKSNENYYLSDDTVIVADDRRSSGKSYDWSPSTSKTLLLQWLAQAPNLHREKSYNILQTICHALTRG